jgi:hypothetical protein
MKQKYLILNGKNENELVIRESAELDKGIVSELFEMTYDREALKAACEKDKSAILSAIRTPIFYPTALCADRLAEAVADFYAAGGSDTVEVSFDDHEALGTKSTVKETEEEPASETELNMLLGSSPEEENLLEDEDIKEIAPPSSTNLKVADENGLGEDDQ